MLANLGEMEVLFLSTLPARGATVTLGALGEPDGAISIHAPREGSDPVAPELLLDANGFLSTLPARGATPEANSLSIDSCFYPRSPRGERRSSV